LQQINMASREAMEESKAASQTLDSPLYYAPTLRPGIGSPRCPRCSAPLSKDLVSLSPLFHAVYVIN
jgi:hypothetical protein